MPGALTAPQAGVPAPAFKSTAAGKARQRLWFGAYKAYKKEAVHDVNSLPMFVREIAHLSTASSLTGGVLLTGRPAEIAAVQRWLPAVDSVNP